MAPREQLPPLARRIRQARDLTGLSQVAFAVRLGQGERTVQAWERGERVPRPAALRGIALLVGKPVVWFYAEPGEVAA